MHRTITIHEEARTLTDAGSLADDALIAEVLELRAEVEQLSKALESRAVIDQARGMVMALASCSGEKAWGLLVDVSQHRNVKLRDVAAALVGSMEGEVLPDTLQRALRDAFRRLHAADRL
ncbi:ANTAR domain-containing protein [Streptomyces sp. NBC_00503]|uniref:ANTAR domain-containing protein n=1 Tax=Streptomyces sp. NBC_00503 TaxID=2903659 RepID=UPI002E81AE18|nr:ANTAR domain-containing protein [Streptomyces sp. NBC_00503]WUD79759.1 ANTAR domain-containing protein [Streptomyces sp. NBC_00503]